MNTINPKQRRFAELYAELGNGSEAAKQARYAVPAVTASRLIRQPKIRAYIDEILEKKSQKLIDTGGDTSLSVAEAHSVIKQLARTSRSDSVKLEAAKTILKVNGLLSETHVIEGRFREKYEHITYDENDEGMPVMEEQD